MSPVKGDPGRGGDRLSGNLYSCSDTNCGKWERENQTIKTARGLIPIQALLFM